MMFLTTIGVLMFASFSGICYCGEEVGKKTTGQPWPMPQTYTPKATVIPVNAFTFQFQDVGSECDVLTQAYKRYFDIIFQPNSEKEALRFSSRHHALRFHSEQDQIMLSVLLVNSTSVGCNEYPSMDMDESYQLSVSPGKAVLTSKAIWGALRGLETFSQIIYETQSGQFVVNQTEIQDFPRFPYRGVLLDTGRHYLKKEYILHNLEAMAQNKYNVFHWHIVDDTSFPYQSKKFPDLSAEGAYNPITHVYTPEDIKEIIEYAKYRGIRVLVEFDTPGHTQAWGDGQPDLLTKCENSQGWDGNYGPINPITTSTWAFLTDFFTEVVQVFPDHYLFLGGDEVSFSCWESNANITKFMKTMGYGGDYSKLELYYMQKLLGIVSKLNKGYLVWQEVIDNGAKVATDTIVNVWKSNYEKEMAWMTSMGYKTILSAPWYLNWIAYGSQWTSLYNVDPVGFNGTAQQKNLILGGNAAMWGEWVDGTNLIPRMWPRASAVAERLWSAASVNSADAAADRIHEHRCRMVKRGFSAEALSGPGFCDVEY